MQLSNTNRKAYVGSPMVPSHLTLGDLERSESWSLNFKALWLVKEPS